MCVEFKYHNEKKKKGNRSYTLTSEKHLKLNIELDIWIVL